MNVIQGSNVQETMKSAIRKEIVPQRRSISHREMMEKSAIIQKLLLELAEYEESESIGLYACIKNEVSTDIIFKQAFEDGKKILFPQIKIEEKGLEFVPVQNLEELVLGPFGILSPPYKENVVRIPEEIELLVIPGVAYDLKGGRLGYGGGFYDRYLQKLVKRPFVVAPAYEFQILDEIPVCPHDVKVDIIVTERRVIYCSGPLVGSVSLRCSPCR